MKIYKYIEMHVEKYLFEIIKNKVYKKQSIKLYKTCKKCMSKNMLDFHVLICI